MTDTEQLISEALKRQAERAPQPGPTLSALRRPARKRSRSSIFLMVGTAAAAAAVLFTAGLLVGKGPGPDSGAAALHTGVVTPSTTLKYEVGWLPDGFVEVSRTVTKDGVTRVWSTGADAVSLTTGAAAPAGYESWDRVPMRGDVVSVRVEGPLATVVLSAPDTVIVSVRGGPDVRGVALTVAASVRPDGQSVVGSALHYQGMSVPKVWGSSPSEWTSEITFDPFTARVSTHPPDLTGGTSVKVRGEQGTFVAGSAPTLAVLDDGVWLVVTGHQATKDQLVEFANDVKVDPKPDYSWLGSRP